MASTETKLIVDYVNNSLKMLNNRLLTTQTFNMLVNETMACLHDRKELYECLPSINESNIAFWYEYLFSKKDELLTTLARFGRGEILQYGFIPEILFEKMVDDFLCLPVESKKKFYETNLTQVKSSAKRPQSKAHQSHYIGKRHYHNLGDNIHHTLPTIYVQNCRATNPPDHERLEALCNDVKITLSINHQEFMDSFGPGLIVCLDNNHVKSHWEYFLMKDKPRLQQVFAAKLYAGDGLEAALRSYIDEGLLPVNIKAPTTAKPFVQHILLRQLRDFETSKPNQLAEQVTHSCQFTSRLHQLHNLSFLSKSFLDNLQQKYQQGAQKHSISSHDKELQKSMLEFSLLLQDIAKGKQADHKPRNKI